MAYILLLLFMLMDDWHSILFIVSAILHNHIVDIPKPATANHSYAL
jgi:hypothetical protein